MTFPVSAEDFAPEDLKNEDPLRYQLRVAIVKKINNAYFEGLNGGENRWDDSPSDYCKDGMHPEECRMFCMVRHIERVAYQRGKSRDGGWA